MHKRRAYLEALKAQLVASGDFLGVWIQRTPPVRNVYPCVTLFSEGETVDMQSIHPAPRPQVRTVNVSVNAWLRGGTDPEKPEASMDDYALSIEQTISKPAGCNDLRLISTDYREDETDPEIFVVALSYQLVYRSTESSPIA